MSETETKNKRRPWLTAIKVVAWTVMAACLLLVGVLVATVKILVPERLTPLVEKSANSMLNADVSIGRVELSMHGSFPLLELTIDSLTLRSRDIRTLSDSRRSELPDWADTLAQFSRLRGGINIFSLARGIIDLSDVELHEPQLNILVVNDSLNNFAIFPTEEDTDTASITALPDIRLRRFALDEPRPLRFVNMVDTLHLTATFSKAELTGDPDTGLPAYHVMFDSDIRSPLFEFFGLENIPIGFDGEVMWTHDNPYNVSLKDFGFNVSVIGGRLNTYINFDDRLLLETFNLELNPLSISEVLDMVPDSVAKRYDIPKDLVTDAKIKFSMALREPYEVGAVGMPFADLEIKIDECGLQWRNLDLRRVAADIGLHLNGHHLNEATVDVRRLLVAGPATTLDMSCRLSDLTSDILFDGTVNGNIILDRLPAVLTNLIPGTIKGRITADGSLRARPSMFTRSNFHQVHASGNLNLDNFYYLSDDTVNFVDLHHASFNFGTKQTLSNGKARADSMLAATLAVDSAIILHSDLDMKLRDLTISLGAQNRAASADSTAINPVGGSIEVGMFSLFTLTDSMGMRVRDIKGGIGLRPLEENPRLPRFNGKLSIGRISVGDNSSRFMISKSNIVVDAHKMPESPRRAETKKAVKIVADSLRKVHPDIPIDSIYSIALQIHNRKHRSGHPRVYPTLGSDDREIMDWGASSLLKRIILEWDVRGTMQASRAGLFTTSFPLRNRVRNFNVEFTTDSVTLTNVEYKAGHSDFLISGNISNIKRALTSRRIPSPLKVHFDMLSDTIDVNELANAFFTGAAAGDRHLDGADLDDEASLERSLAGEISQTDSIGPLLIPTNIDAELKIQADNVLYSDLLLHNLRGALLAYDGALNIHNLTASSDVGSVDLSALYMAPSVKDMHFGFGLKLNSFNIGHFLRLVPAVDSLMPMIRGFNGIVSANIAATSEVDPQMNLDLPSLRAAIKLEGDSLVLIDEQTFKTMAKWLLFHDKKTNMIRHMAVEMVVEDGEMQMFPFIFDFDRYRLGIQGHNDLAMNFDYHVAVLKSPIPFKFGINIKGNPDKYKIRLGRARFNEKSAQRYAMVDTTRINLMKQIEGVFRRGVCNSRFARLDIANKPEAAAIDLDTDTISRTDSLYFIEQGLIPAPMQPESPDMGKKKKRRK